MHLLSKIICTETVPRCFQTSELQNAQGSMIDLLGAAIWRILSLNL